MDRTKYPANWNEIALAVKEEAELWREKITDHVNYLVLLEALLLDQ